MRFMMKTHECEPAPKIHPRRRVRPIDSLEDVVALNAVLHVEVDQSAGKDVVAA